MTRRRAGLALAWAALSLGAGLVVEAARATPPAVRPPAACVTVAAGVPAPAPHAWERRCAR